MHVVCPWHGFEYDVVTGRHPGRPDLALRSFPVTEDGGGSRRPRGRRPGVADRAHRIDELVATLAAEVGAGLDDGAIAAYAATAGRLVSTAARRRAVAAEEGAEPPDARDTTDRRRRPRHGRPAKPRPGPVRPRPAVLKGRAASRGHADRGAGPSERTAHDRTDPSVRRWPPRRSPSRRTPEILANAGATPPPRGRRLPDRRRRPRRRRARAAAEILADLDSPVTTRHRAADDATGEASHLALHNHPPGLTRRTFGRHPHQAALGEDTRTWRRASTGTSRSSGARWTR